MTVDETQPAHNTSGSGGIEIVSADDLRRYNALLEDVGDRSEFAGGQAGLFWRRYAMLRIGSILFASAAASTVLFSNKYVSAALSLLVVIITSIDGWLKPELQWKVHDEYNDKFDQMEIRLKGIKQNDSKSLDAFEAKMVQLVEEYRKARLP